MVVLVVIFVNLTCLTCLQIKKKYDVNWHNLYSVFNRKHWSLGQVFSPVGFWPCYIYELFPVCVSTRLIAAWISCSILLTRKDVGSWWLSEPCLNWNWWPPFFFLCKNEITRTNLTRFPFIIFVKNCLNFLWWAVVVWDIKRTVPSQCTELWRS